MTSTKKRLHYLLLAAVIVFLMWTALMLILLSPRFFLEEEMVILETRAGQLSAQWPGDTFTIWYWHRRTGSIRLWPPGGT